MRVATSCPAATEIVCAVGGLSALVAVSDACDYPAGPGGVTALPRMPGARAELEPEFIVTDAAHAPETHATDIATATVLVLGTPRCLEDVFAACVRVGDALDLGLTARAVVTGLRARLAAVTERVTPLAERPRVPVPSDAPPWLAELITLAGGTPDASDSAAEVAPLASPHFTRPGPRLIDAVEILAAWLHPSAFPELVRRHAARTPRPIRPAAPGAASDTS